MYSKGLADTDFHVFEGRRHTLSIDSGCKDVADFALTWFASKGISHRTSIHRRVWPPR